MDWKVGDKFVSLAKAGHRRRVGSVFQIVDINNYSLMYDDEHGVHEKFLHTIEKAHIPNKLNRKLYPNYVKYEGHLISPKAMDTIREHND